MSEAARGKLFIDQSSGTSKALFQCHLRIEEILCGYSSLFFFVFFFGKTQTVWLERERQTNRQTDRQRLCNKYPNHTKAQTCIKAVLSITVKNCFLHRRCLKRCLSTVI